MFESPQVNFYVRDVEESARFYQESFGFTETFRTPPHGPPAHAELRLGAFTLGLATFDSLRDVHGITADGSGPPRAEVVVWTDDVDRAYAMLAARNARTLSAPHDFAGSLRAAWVADPDGNPVQIVMRRRLVQVVAATSRSQAARCHNHPAGAPTRMAAAGRRVSGPGRVRWPR